MSREVTELILREFGLEGDTEKLLLKNIRSLDRGERRYYFKRIKPMEKEIKNFLERRCFHSGDEFTEQVVRNTVDSMLARRGDPDLVDSMVMDVIGRIKIYKNLRERSESEGVKLSALTNFGGLSMVLFAVVIITAIVLYIKSLF